MHLFVVVFFAKYGIEASSRWLCVKTAEAEQQPGSSAGSWESTQPKQLGIQTTSVPPLLLFAAWRFILEEVGESLSVLEGRVGLRKEQPEFRLQSQNTKKLPIRFYCVPRYLVMGDCSELGVTHWISQKCSRMTATGIVSNYCVQRRYILPRCRTNRLKYSFVPAATGLLNRCLIDESVCSFQCCLLCCMLLLLCDCGWLFCVTAWG